MNAHATGVAPIEQPEVDLRPAIDKMETWGPGTRMNVLKALAAGKQDHEIKKECDLNMEVGEYLERKIFREFGFPESRGHLRRKDAVDAYRAFMTRPDPIQRPVQVVPHGEPPAPAPAAPPVKLHDSSKPLVLRRPPPVQPSSQEETVVAPSRKYFPAEDVERGARIMAGLDPKDRELTEMLAKHELRAAIAKAMGRGLGQVVYDLDQLYLKLGLPPRKEVTIEGMEEDRDFAILAHEYLLSHPDLEPLPAVTRKTRAARSTATNSTSSTKRRPAILQRQRVVVVVNEERARSIAMQIDELTPVQKQCLLVFAARPDMDAVAKELKTTTDGVRQRLTQVFKKFDVGKGRLSYKDRDALLARAVQIYQTLPEPLETPPEPETPEQPVIETGDAGGGVEERIVTPEEPERPGEFLEEDLDRVAREIDSIIAPLQLFLLRGFASGKTIPELRAARGNFSAGSIEAVASTLRHKILSVPAELSPTDARTFMGAAYLRSETASVDPNGRVLVTLSNGEEVTNFALLYPLSPTYDHRLSELKRAGYEPEVVVLVKRK